jgi:release factor glutamine methyltransferase
LDNHQSEDDLTVLDIGTGSGCIPVALKMEQPNWDVSGIDISEDALNTARENAEQNSADVSFSTGDILNPDSISISGSLDLIVSNPPYVKPEEKDILEQQVNDYEPAEALFFDDLNKMYNSIIEFASQKLTENGFLYLELHENYSQQILALFEEKKWSARIKNDYDNKPRFIIAQQR